MKRNMDIQPVSQSPTKAPSPSNGKPPQCAPLQPAAPEMPPAKGEDWEKTDDEYAPSECDDGGSGSESEEDDIEYNSGEEEEGDDEDHAGVPSSPSKAADDGIDVSNIITGKRTRRAVTRYVHPDMARMMVADIPESERFAALEDENFSESDGHSSEEEEVDESETEEDANFIALDEEDEGDTPSRKKRRKDAR